MAVNHQAVGSIPTWGEPFEKKENAYVDDERSIHGCT